MREYSAIVDDQVLTLSVSNVWSEHFRVDRVIGHYHEMLHRLPTTR